MTTRRHILRFASLALAPLAASAQTPYPSKAVRIVVPFGAGGVADLTARAVGQRLSQRLGQPVLIDNRPLRPSTLRSTAACPMTPYGTSRLSP